MLRFPNNPIMCLRVSDDIDAVIWVKKCLHNIDAVFEFNRVIRDSSLWGAVWKTTIRFVNHVF